MSLLTDLNRQYMALHREKEEAFWTQKMGLKHDLPIDFESKEIALNLFSSNPENLERVRTKLERADLTEEERTGLQGWKRFFEVNTIEGAEARAAFNRVIELEGELGRARGGMDLGYTDPATGEFRRASSVELALMIQNNPDEAVRRAAWEGMRSIEPFVLEHGFIDVVKERNRLGKLLGYQDYYDYKVSINEGFGKEKLFELLDDLERNTRDACRLSMERLAAELGDDAVQPWDMEYNTAGDLTAQVDPYLRFDAALGVWGRSFAAMGIAYNGATMQLDLVDRRGKYENGFMHGPSPGYVENGEYRRAKINFTANAVPGQIGSGKNALRTLLHEGGHAAHFGNIMMPAPCFAQEFAPTSVAFAETQSMFLDSLMSDADWLTRYARNEAGESMPVDLIRRLLEKDHLYRAHYLRRLLAVSYAEKAIYEMSEEEMTPENILRVLRDVETRLLYQPAAARPLLAIPHLLAGESSAYYHGYTLAQMAVYQTRDFFLKRDGHIMDNPRIGEDLRKHYWLPGNSKTFLEMVEDLTGEPFSARATVELVNKPIEEIYADADRMIEKEREIAHRTGAVDLHATLAVVHGDDVIASTSSGESFEEIDAKFSRWIREQEAARA